jgi:hypothetical protein
MKKIIMGSLVLFSLLATADNMSIARKLVVNEIEKYASDYGVLNVSKIDDQGVVNKKYSFMVSYSKQFCWDTGDDERATCADFSCASVATVDSDAVVEFESEPSKKSCQEIPGTRTTESY